MKMYILVLILLGQLVLSLPGYGFMPFAPVADIPDGLRIDSELEFVISSIKNVIFFEKDEVGLPAFPGALSVQTAEGENGVLPMIRLVSSSEVHDVALFYKKNLPGWTYSESGGVHWFREKDATGAPRVRVETAGRFKKAGRSVKTEISIWFN